MLKKKTITFGVCTALVLIFLCASVVAIFANSNLLVKTNVSVSYSAPTLDSAYVATNYWRMGDEEKTESLARTKVEDVQPSSSITTELTRDYNYVVYEFVMENQSPNAKYYFQSSYTNNTSDDTNIYFKYCSSVGNPIEIENILDEEMEEVVEYTGTGATILSNNVVASTGQTVYAYAIIAVDDIWYDAKFSGAFTCNISLEPFSDKAQHLVVHKGTTSNNKTYYYLEMGEMPQSYVGADASLYTLSDKVYTECGVDYEVYTDESGARYAKKEEKYYKFEPIRWEIRAYSIKLGNDHSPATTYNNIALSNKVSKWLYIISEKILFNSSWHSTLTRKNYSGCTALRNLASFYNSIVKPYDKYLVKMNISMNNSTEYSIPELKDYISTTYGIMYIDQWIWLPNTTLVSNSQFMSTKASRQAYYTDWAIGSDGTAAYGKWWTRTNQYNNTDGEIFVANAVDTDGNFVATNIDEVCGVRPAMVATLY